jgi:uncharacterized Zn finger protein (UPF0148 family)
MSTKRQMAEKTGYLRVWKKISVEEIEKNLLLIDDLYGTCGNCKKLGLNYLKDKTCPNCGVTFKYVATHQKNIADVIKILNRMESQEINLTMIEREDYNKLVAKDALKDLFKS